ncbi:MAG: hypothetical protein QOJ42_5586, partial [Acidobacteriaceae bacterium]|nr:hypothetical protein [Acidobacteriaceae bacterium]
KSPRHGWREVNKFLNQFNPRDG